MDVNVLSMFLTCRAVVPQMRAQGGGRIVNISSGTPFRGVPFLLHYVTSKGAIVALTRALAKELGGDDDPRQLRGARLHHERRRAASIPRSSRRCRTSRSARARSSATRCPRTSSARWPSCAGRARRSSPARRWSSTEASTSIEALAHRAPARAPRPTGRPEPRRRTSSTTAARSCGSSPTRSRAGALLSADGRARRRDRVAHALRPRRLRAGRHRLPPHPSRARASATCSSARSRSTRWAPSTRWARASRGSSAGPTRCWPRRRPTSPRPSCASCCCPWSGPASARSATSTPPTPTSPRPSARRSSSSSRCAR